MGPRCVLPARRRERGKDAGCMGHGRVRRRAGHPAGHRPRIRCVGVRRRRRQRRADQPSALAVALRRGSFHRRPQVHGVRERSPGRGGRLHHHRRAAAGFLALQYLHGHPRAAARADLSVPGPPARWRIRRSRGGADHGARLGRRRTRAAGLERAARAGARSIRRRGATAAPRRHRRGDARAARRVRQRRDAVPDPRGTAPQGDRRPQRPGRGTMDDRTHAARRDGRARHRGVRARAGDHQDDGERDRADGAAATGQERAGCPHRSGSRHPNARRRVRRRHRRDDGLRGRADDDGGAAGPDHCAAGQRTDGDGQPRTAAPPCRAHRVRNRCVSRARGRIDVDDPIGRHAAAQRSRFLGRTGHQCVGDAQTAEVP